MLVMGGTFTLGTGAALAMCVGIVVGCTLGDVAGGVDGAVIGIGWIRFNCVAKVKSAFLTGSPASKLGVVVDGGDVNIVIISVAAWRKKSSNFISGNGT